MAMTAKVQMFFKPKVAQQDSKDSGKASTFLLRKIQFLKTKSEVILALKCLTSGFFNLVLIWINYSNQCCRIVLWPRAFSLLQIKLVTLQTMALPPTLKGYWLILLRKVTVLFYLLMKAWMSYNHVKWIHYWDIWFLMILWPCYVPRSCKANQWRNKAVKCEYINSNFYRWTKLES